MMLGLVMLMAARPGVGQAYLVGWLMVMYLGQSILILSHAAWGATLATTYNARARIFGIMAGMGVIGALGVLAIPIVMERNGYSDAQGVQAMIWYVIALTPAAVGLVVWRTPETIAPEVHGQRFRLRDYLDLITHHSMWRILAADFCLVMGPGWMAALFLFFKPRPDGLHHRAGQHAAGRLHRGSLFGAPIIGWLATRIGKHRAAMLSSFIFSVSLVSLLFLPKGNVLASVPTNFINGFVAAGFGALIRAMVADVSDDIRLTQGKERAGLLFSADHLDQQDRARHRDLPHLLAAGAGGLQPRPGHTNTPAAIQGLTYTFLGGPILFLALGRPA
jgi:Na+/melibiose symporter-like transporter